MAVKGCKTKLYIGELDLSLSTTDFTYTTSVNIITFSTLQNCSIQKIPGISTPTISANGIILDADSPDDFRTRVQDKLDSSDNGVITWMLDTDNTAPVGGAFSTGYASEFTIDTPIDNLLAVQSKWEKTTTLISGIFLSNSETASATGPLTNFADFGAAGVDGGNALLIVSAITGTATSASIEIESDDNAAFTSPTTEGVHIFSGVGTFPITLSGAVDRYLRANVTSLGGATDFTVSLLIGINGVTQ